MKHIFYLITGLVILALLAGATAVRAEDNLKMQPAGMAMPESAPANITFSYLFLQGPLTSDPWWRSHMVVDGSGGAHVTFYDGLAIYYAHCTANCGVPNNWLVLPLYGPGTYTSLAYPTLGVDASDHPRLMWFATYEGDSNYFYAECNANCADNSANWTSVAVTSSGYAHEPDNGRYAALDTQGRPRLIYPMSESLGFNYTSCDANCTNASNWQNTEVPTPGMLLEALQIVLDPNGRPRVAGNDLNLDTLAYAECNSSCSIAANWGNVSLPMSVNFYGAYDGFALRVDAQGRPRIAYFNPDNNVLHYAWSNNTPLTVGGWQSYTLNYLNAVDYWAVDLALDSQGKPSVVFATNEFDLSYLTCTAGCETNSPTWQQQFIETGADLDVAFPIPVASGCQSSSWEITGYPSLALDTTDGPSISYLARHKQTCNVSTVYDASSIRFATAGGTAQSANQIYLPFIIR